MRNKIAGLGLLFATALATTLAAPTPAHADSSSTQRITFYNNGWYYAYADVWGYDAQGNEVFHGWSGSGGHAFHNFIDVPDSDHMVVTKTKQKS